MAYAKEKGSVVSKTEIQTGKTQTGNDWKKQVVIIQVEDKKDDKVWSRTLALTAFGNVVDFTQDLQAKDSVEFSYQAKSREYNGKWYTDLNLLSIRKEGDAAAAPAPQPIAPVSTQAEDDFPF